MKQWQKRSAVILGLGLLGFGGLLLRPAFLPDSMRQEEDGEAEAAPKEEARGGLPDIEANWDLRQAIGNSCVLHTEGEDAFALLREPVLQLRFRQAGEQVQLHSTWKAEGWGAGMLCQAETKLRILPLGSFPQRMPSGQFQQQSCFLLELDCKLQRPFLQKTLRSIVRLLLRADMQAGVLEIANCQSFMLGGQNSQRIISTQQIDAPLRFEGNLTEQALLRQLYMLAAVDSPARAVRVAYLLEQEAGELVSRAEAGKPWPDCWGSAAETAMLIRRRVPETLAYLQEQQCFDCRALADYINGPLFARLYGAEEAPAEERGENAGNESSTPEETAAPSTATESEARPEAARESTPAEPSGHAIEGANEGADECEDAEEI